MLESKEEYVNNTQYSSISEEINEILTKRWIYFILKRIFDILFSCFCIVILSPFLLVIAIWIKLDSEGQVFYKQIRVGKDGINFTLYKFRTMVMDADKKGLQITVGNDSRIVRSGKFLRKSKLDELPQLFNVLKGDMSIIGPRPEVIKYVELYNEDQKSILKVRPGLTDYASLEYRNENELLGSSNTPEKTYIDEIMPHKIELNMKYLRHMSLLIDFKITIKTILTIVRGD